MGREETEQGIAAPDPQAPVSETARAKVNLTLHIRGRRDDGYHELESLVAFADVGDALTLFPGNVLLLDAARTDIALPPDLLGPDNIVLQAVRAAQARLGPLRAGRIRLEKRLPVAAGLGGGSADAAAVLRMLAQVNGLDPRMPELLEIAAGIGADVPVCMVSRAAWMTGIGEVVTPLVDFPALDAVLINPGVPIATARVFEALAMTPGESVGKPTPVPDGDDAIRHAIRAGRNDLQGAAIDLCPQIGIALAALDAAGAGVSRMSGSGATVFGLFEGTGAARVAAEQIAGEHPDWWVRPVRLS